MTLDQIETMTGIPLNGAKPPQTNLEVAREYRRTLSPETDEPGDFFNPFVLHNNFNEVPEMDSDYEHFLQERHLYPAGQVGTFALILFKEGLEFEEDKRRKSGEVPINYTYWVRLLPSEIAEQGYSIEFGLRGTERPSVQAIMARCAIANGLPSRDTSVEALENFVEELRIIEEIDQNVQPQNVIELRPKDADSTDDFVYAVAGS